MPARSEDVLDVGLPPPGEATGRRRPAAGELPRDRCWRVTSLVRVRGRGVELGPLKTEASYRTVPLPAATAEALARHLAEFPVGDDGLVFTNERGAPIQQYPFSQAWATARVKAALPAWATRPHDLRHH